jgi:glyoxylase-like metal-dependent hydrolase (beta-lactamase superfamily II)
MSDSGSSAIQEVAANLYKIKLSMPFEPFHINVYLLKGTNRLALVDTGLPMAWEDLQQGFKALNIPFEQLTDIFLTHYHIDHIGSLSSLREAAPGAKIFFHQLDHDFMRYRTAKPQESNEAMYKWLLRNGAADLGGDPAGFPIQMIELKSGDTLVEGGEKVSLRDETDGWEVVWTPGHTNGHFVLYNREQRLLLSGDHLLTTISSNIGQYPGSRPDPLGDFMSSLDKLAALEVDEILPAHGHPFGNHRHRIENLKSHHRHRMNKIIAGLEHSPLTAKGVAHTIWGDRLKGFNRYLGLMEVLSHLERLRIEGQILAEEHEGIVYYRQN